MYYYDDREVEGKGYCSECKQEIPVGYDCIIDRDNGDIFCDSVCAMSFLIKSPHYNFSETELTMDDLYDIS